MNGGRVTSHVHTISKEQFKANFIPHDPGRHRVDVKFNGEKVTKNIYFIKNICCSKNICLVSYTRYYLA